VVQVSLEEGEFHLYAGATEGPVYGIGPAPVEPGLRLALDAESCLALARGEWDATALPVRA
jgi:hypothetical protein